MPKRGRPLGAPAPKRTEPAAPVRAAAQIEVALMLNPQLDVSTAFEEDLEVRALLEGMEKPPDNYLLAAGPDLIGASAAKIAMHKGLMTMHKDLSEDHREQMIAEQEFMRSNQQSVQMDYEEKLAALREEVQSLKTERALAIIGGSIWRQRVDEYRTLYQEACQRPRDDVADARVKEVGKALIRELRDEIPGLYMRDGIVFPLS